MRQDSLTAEYHAVPEVTEFDIIKTRFRHRHNRVRVRVQFVSLPSAVWTNVYLRGGPATALGSTSKCSSLRDSSMSRPASCPRAAPATARCTTPLTPRTMWRFSDSPASVWGGPAGCNWAPTSQEPRNPTPWQTMRCGSRLSTSSTATRSCHSTAHPWELVTQPHARTLRCLLGTQIGASTEQGAGADPKVRQPVSGAPRAHEPRGRASPSSGALCGCRPGRGRTSTSSARPSRVQRRHRAPSTRLR